jgi:hypothetical protein
LLQLLLPPCLVRWVGGLLTLRFRLLDERPFLSGLLQGDLLGHEPVEGDFELLVQLHVLFRLDDAGGCLDDSWVVVRVGISREDRLAVPGLLLVLV